MNEAVHFTYDIVEGTIVVDEGDMNGVVYLKKPFPLSNNA